jgi:hypothetical protein
MKRENGGSPFYEALYAKVGSPLLHISLCLTELCCLAQAAKQAAEREAIRKVREIEGCTFKPQVNKRAHALKCVSFAACDFVP